MDIHLGKRLWLCGLKSVFVSQNPQSDCGSSGPPTTWSKLQRPASKQQIMTLWWFCRRACSCNYCVPFMSALDICTERPSSMCCSFAMALAGKRFKQLWFREHAGWEHPCQGFEINAQGWHYEMVLRSCMLRDVLKGRPQVLSLREIRVPCWDSWAETPIATCPSYQTKGTMLQAPPNVVRVAKT